MATTVSDFPLFISLICFILLAPFPFFAVESSCSKGCDLALASYYVWNKSTFGFDNNLSYVSSLFGGANMDEIIRYSPPKTSRDFILTGSRLLVPFRCDCLNQTFLGQSFKYAVKTGDTYNLIARYYSNLTTPQLLQKFGNSSLNRIGDDSGNLNVVVNCSCGNKSVSGEYGLFATYSLLAGDTLKSVANGSNLSENLLQKFNPGKKFSAGSGLVYIPVKDVNGSYRPFIAHTNEIPGGAVAGICVGAIIIVILLAVMLYIGVYKKGRVKKAMLLSASSFEDHSDHIPNGASSQTTGFTVNKSVEFSYEELSTATNNFNLANKIGQGGFGSVYYAELRGEKAAIKKMDMQASKEFLAELKVLSNVHHLNLVRLIGYCVEEFLFVVYEYIENGNLSQHLHGSGNEPLTWSNRVQIALDSARGLEYIHEHTVPVYIHRDIKSANILIDEKFHGKVADFGLTKLTEVANTSRPTHLDGTFGYMPPEYARYGDVSPKVDVFALGVVLFELISGKEAIIRNNSADPDSTTGLVALFDEIFSEPYPKEGLRKVVDPRLGDDYLFESVWKMAQLAKACTEEDPNDRPTMRSVVVALMTALSSSTEEWDAVSFYENQALANLRSGR